MSTALQLRNPALRSSYRRQLPWELFPDVSAPRLGVDPFLYSPRVSPLACTVIVSRTLVAPSLALGLPET